MSAKMITLPGGKTMPRAKYNSLNIPLRLKLKTGCPFRPWASSYSHGYKYGGINIVQRHRWTLFINREPILDCLTLEPIIKFVRRAILEKQMKLTPGSTDIDHAYRHPNPPANYWKPVLDARLETGWPTVLYCTHCLWMSASETYCHCPYGHGRMADIKHYKGFLTADQIEALTEGI